MRILHVSSLYPPHIVGGAEKSVSLIANTLNGMGHQVGAVCLSPGAYVREVVDGVDVFRLPHGNSFWMEDWAKHNSVERLLQKAGQNFNFEFGRTFERVIKDFKPDVINTHSMVDVSSYIWSAAERLGVPVVHTLRDYTLSCANSAMFRRGKSCNRQHLKCQVLTAAANINHRSVKAVVGVGDQILKRHLGMGYFRTVDEDLRKVIWNPAIVSGVPADYVKPSKSDKKLVLGYLGRINTEKGVETLLDAVRQVEGRDWRLVIAGEAMEGIERFVAKAKGLPIEFRGFMNPRDFFEEIDLLIVPSIWPEPLPRTILESYAMRTPALGARSGGIPDLIGESNSDWLFDAGDAKDLARQIQEKIRTGRASFPNTADFNAVLRATAPSVVAGEYLKLYETVLNRYG